MRDEFVPITTELAEGAASGGYGVSDDQGQGMASPWNRA
jgi:hypothetical protein